MDNKLLSNDFSHLDAMNRPAMVDVGGKDDSLREAIAESRILLPIELMPHLSGGEINTPKGAVFQTAIIAGVMAAKKTAELIPLCHSLLLDHCSVTVDIQNGNEVYINCKVRTIGKTGVEMEALTGASVAALTIYDMCKAFTHDMEITQTRLLSKTGGKHDFKRL